MSPLLTRPLDPALQHGSRNRRGPSHRMHDHSSTVMVAAPVSAFPLHFGWPKVCTRLHASIQNGF